MVFSIMPVCLVVLCLLLSGVPGIEATETSTALDDKTRHHHRSQYHPSDYHPPLDDYQDNALPWCSPENLNLRNASSGDFYLLPDGTFRYEFPHCKLRRFTASMTSHCLKGTHIVFMGDSLSRYLYISLAHLLATHHWGRKFCQVFHKDLPISILNEKDYKLWHRFYQDSNILLNNGKRSIEICDCFRRDGLPFIGLNGLNQQASDCSENRHFRYMPSSDANDDAHDVRLSYIQWYGLMPMRGHRKISTRIPRNESIYSFLDELNKQTCPPQTIWPVHEECSKHRPDQIYYDFPHFGSPEICSDYSKMKDPNDDCQKFEREILGSLGTTHLIMNIGWHNGLMHLTPHFLEKVSDAAERYFSYPGPEKDRFNPKLRQKHAKTNQWGNIHLPRVTWRTSTYDAVFNMGDETARQFSIVNGTERLEYFAVFEMTKKLRLIQLAVERKDTTQLKKLVKLSKWWTKGTEIPTDIPFSWTDPAHTEPWVYTEIHEVFLNSICPLKH